MKKTGLYKYVYDFSVHYDSINADDILDIYNYLMKKHHIKCLDLMKGFSAWTIGIFGDSLVFNSRGPWNLYL